MRNIACVVLGLLLFWGDLTYARPRRNNVHVEIDSDQRIGPALNLRLRFCLISNKNDKPIKFPMKLDPVMGGAGIVVEHISPDGKRTRQKRPRRSRWFDNVRQIELKPLPVSRELDRMYFDVWVNFGPQTVRNDKYFYFDFSRPGVYQISYEHPWKGLEEDPNSFWYSSDKLTVVMPGKTPGLERFVRERPKLDLASHLFRYPPLGKFEKYSRKVGIIDEYIADAQQDMVFFLLGSPDFIAVTKPYDKEIFDISWHYDTSPVGGYYVWFKNGKVVKRGYHADSPNP